MKKIIMPFAGKYPVTQGFGVKVNYMRSGLHTGVDWGLPKGTPLVAVFAGKVIKAANWQLGGYGREIQIQAKDGTIAQYAHCSEIFVKEGTEIEQGTIVGKSGNTGYVIALNGGTGAHLHFGIKVKNEWVNPITFINQGKLFEALQEDHFEVKKEEKKIEVKNEDFETYTIKKNDTLSKICRDKLGNGNLWRKLWEYNKTEIANPHEIYVGQEIKIPNSLKQNADNS